MCCAGLVRCKLVRGVQVPCCWSQLGVSTSAWSFHFGFFFFPQLWDLWGFILKCLLLSVGSTSLSEDSHCLPRSLTDCRHRQARGSCVLRCLPRTFCCSLWCVTILAFRCSSSTDSRGSKPPLSLLSLLSPGKRSVPDFFKA